MTPNDVSDAVVTALKARLGATVRSIEPHTGIFDDAELARFGAAVPAVRVAIVGFGGFGRHSTGECIVPLRFAAVCLAKDVATAGQPMVSRRAAVQALATAVALAVDMNCFGLSGVYVPEDLAARNQYSTKGDELALSIWQVTWTTRVLMGASIDETLAALTKLFVNTVQIADPAPIPGADPVTSPTSPLGLPPGAKPLP